MERLSSYGKKMIALTRVFLNLLEKTEQTKSISCYIDNKRDVVVVLCLYKHKGFKLGLELLL